jgi:WD40-like Beta Propeller Repeat
MEADGGNRAVIPGSQSDREPAFSPDGKRIVARTWIFELQHSQLVTYDRAGTSRALIPGTEGAEDPDWQPIFGPRRDDFKNAAHFCKAQREFLGEAEFAQRYGGGANAYGKCVSGN